MTATNGAVSAIRADGWANILTGLGLLGRDKRLGSDYGTADRLDQSTLEQMYAGDAMAAKIVDTLPADMTRQWVDLTIPGDDGATVSKAVLDDLRRIQAQARIHQGLSWARLYGGALVLIGANDGQKADMPLDLARIEEVRFLTVLDRWQVQVERTYADPTEPRFGEPELYAITPTTATGAGASVSVFRVHESRTIRFEGVDLPVRLRQQNQGWGDSVLNRVYNALRGFATSHDSAGTILTDFAQAVYKLSGIANMMGQGNDQAVINRLLALDKTRSIVKGIVLDSEEEYERRSTSVTGLSDLIQAAERRLVAEAGMPHSLLLGEAPGASLGEGGQAQTRDWYDRVKSEQEQTLRDPLERLTRLLMLARNGPTAGKVPDGWALSFRSLWQLDDVESAKLRYQQAQTDALYLSHGVVSPEEIATSRFGGDGYSTDTAIDMDARAADNGDA